MAHDEWQQIIEDACALVRQSADRRGRVAVSPEVAALLQGTMAAAPAVSLPSGEGGSLEDIAAVVAACTLCGLSETRLNTVFGSGNPDADLVFVGEAPGADEDKQGLPFVGRAGQLLTDIIEKGMGLSRQDVYICNVLKCRPPNNRDPQPDERASCEPYLKQQLAAIRPKVICALGKHAAQTLLRTDASLNQLRGQWHFYEGIPLRVTYHPAYLLRTPGDKAKCWADIQQVMKVLRGEETPRPGGTP